MNSALMIFVVVDRVKRLSEITFFCLKYIFYIVLRVHINTRKHTALNFNL